MHLHRSEEDAPARAQALSALQGQREAIERRQTKLIELYYGDGISRDVLVREQRTLAEALSRITAEQARSEDDALRLQRVSVKLELLEGAHARYIAAAPHERKQVNNALFSRVLIGPASDDLRVELLPEITEALAIDSVSEGFV